jgi:hypothetical protein
VGDGSLQSYSGASLHPKTAKDRVDVPKGGEADGVALTEGGRGWRPMSETGDRRPEVRGRTDMVVTVSPH